MKRLKNFKFRSVLSRFFLFFLLIFFIIFIQNWVVNVYARSYINKNILSERKLSLAVLMNQVDRELTILNSFIIQTVSKNENYLKLLHLPQDRDNNYKIVNSYVLLGNEFNEQLNNMYYEDGFFAVFPEKNIFLFRGYNADIQEKVPELIEAWDDGSKSRWMVVQAGEGVYAVCLYRQQWSWCGAWVSLDSVIERLHHVDQTHENQYYLADESGNLLTGSASAQFSSEGRDSKTFAGNGNIEQATVLPEDGGTLRNGLETYHAVSVPSEILGVSLTELVGQNDMLSHLPGIYIFSGVFSVAALLAGILFISWLHKNMLSPLRKLDKAIATVEDGNLSYRISAGNTHNEFEVLNQEFNGMLEQVNTLKLDIYEMTIEQQRTKLRYLSQQIQPHFILNVLNILYSYEAEDHALIRQMLMYLSRYFRYIVNIHSDFVPLGAEIRHVENYLNIQKVRYPYQFEHTLTMDDRLKEAAIPPLLIQTFVENSIKYAVSSRSVIDISVEAKWLDEHCYELIIYDTGPGYPDHILAGIERFMKDNVTDKGLGIGITNAIERLNIIYHKEARIWIGNRQPHGTLIRLKLPLLYLETDESGL